MYSISSAYTTYFFVSHDIVQQSDYIPFLIHVQIFMSYEHVQERRQNLSSCFENWTTSIDAEEKPRLDSWVS